MHFGIFRNPRARIVRIIACIVISFTGVAAISAAEPIIGTWISISDTNGSRESVVAIYQYRGKLYGRLLATFTDDGKAIEETHLNASARSDALHGNPLYVGIDYVYNLVDTGKEWSGLIMDPRTGEEYDCRIWREPGKLIVRGQLKGIFGGLFGRNQTWLPLTPGIVPANIVFPDPVTFVPKIPLKK